MSHFDVRDYGATGFGVADNTEAFLLAIEAADQEFMWQLELVEHGRILGRGERMDAVSELTAIARSLA